MANPSPGPPAHRIVSLLTDFGLTDPYAGVMKAVLLAHAPGASIVDLTHLTPPQDITAGAFLLQSAWRHFPHGSVHVAVVDPGVGSDRRRLILEAEGHYFVGPDNGLLSSALPDAARGPRHPDESYTSRMVEVPAGVNAFAFEPSRADDVSATFEGRDVFAPAAGRLAAGLSPAGLGRPVANILALPAFRAPRHADGLSEGVVLHVDHYGNAITDIRGDDLPARCEVLAGGRRLRLSRTYSESGGLCAIVSSAGYLEVALAGGHAARELGLASGSTVTAKPA